MKSINWHYSLVAIKWATQQSLSPFVLLRCGSAFFSLCQCVIVHFVTSTSPLCDAIPIVRRSHFYAQTIFSASARLFVCLSFVLKSILELHFPCDLPLLVNSLTTFGHLHVCVSVCVIVGKLLIFLLLDYDDEDKVFVVVFILDVVLVCQFNVINYLQNE